MSAISAYETQFAAKIVALNVGVKCFGFGFVYNAFAYACMSKITGRRENSRSLPNDSQCQTLPLNMLVVKQNTMHFLSCLYNWCISYTFLSLVDY